MFIVIFEPFHAHKEFPYQWTLHHLKEQKGFEFKLQEIEHAGFIHREALITSESSHVSVDDIAALPGVAKVISMLDKFPLIKDGLKENGFEYQGVHFNQENFELFAGLCAVDHKKNVEEMMRTLQENNLPCTRMGAYKPRTNPYAFQGHGKECLPYVFELAGKYGIKVIAMEITHEKHLDEIDSALEQCGRPTGVMAQVGTRNAQNFELLRSLGQQTSFPILYKRGFGVSLSDSLQAVEYIAQGGNRNIIFCLRGIQSHLGAPHRNLADFSLIPVLKRLTRLPICIDPSHSIGTMAKDNNNIPDILHASSQGIIAGANMVLVDFHPCPEHALVDGRQSLKTSQLKWYVEDLAITRQAYLNRLQLAKKFNTND